MKDNRFLTMGIESSCDETAISIVADGREILSNVISSQINIFINYGGVVPEIASRNHLENINWVMDEALKKAGVTLDDIDLIGVTYGPGLEGALLMGVAHAKAVAFSKDIPLVGVHHIMGHISANYLEHKELEPPFMALVTSGGHTEICDIRSYTDCEIIGTTRDDAIGEAFDKVARVLALGYPGGPKVDRLAREGNPDAINFKRVYLEKGTFDFSFSGIKTQVLNYVNTEKQAGREIVKADVAASFTQAVMDVLRDKTRDAVKMRHAKKLVLAGGVAANSKLREMLGSLASEMGFELFIPSNILCTDNGAMIASYAYYKYMSDGPDALDLETKTTQDMKKERRK
ncbi:MAG: tRNA (adenosine(37)-N6)-threonylcarbamoyltransferase complex transferase subunit TsaD [Clostridia bacterium]|nr:tRNA (adenosine(37)-N6)-threonylcarbamoyltransferase complex transferase subunit TsaD [Clostridia bacterium]